jgi:hypothetical protein
MVLLNQHLRQEGYIGREELNISIIPIEVGRYKFDPDEYPTEPIATYWIGHDDETDAFWIVTDSDDNYVEILSIDTVENIIKCKFNLKLKKERGENYPKYVTFTEGYIEADYNY